MRDLMTDDFYLVSEIVDKMDLTLPSKTKVVDKKVVNKTQEEYGTELIVALFKKAYKAKDQINELIGILIEKDPSKLTFKETKDAMFELFKNEGFLSFFN